MLMETGDLENKTGVPCRLPQDSSAPALHLVCWKTSV